MQDEKKMMEQSNPPLPPKETLPTMYVVILVNFI